MEKLKPLTIFVLLSLLSSGCASTGKIKQLGEVGGVTRETVTAGMSRRVDFPTDIRFTYLMAWNGVPIGKIIATSYGIKEYRGRDVYVVSVVTESNRFLSKIYRVEDVYTSYIDTETMTSMRFEADRREGNYRKHLVVEYDFEDMQAIHTNLTDGSVKKCAIGPEVQDPVSAMCRFMTMSVGPGDNVHMVITLNEKNYDLYGRVEDLDVIKLPRLGEFPAFKLVPYAALKGKEVKKGHGWMYFEAGKRKYPLYGRVWIPFGRVTATLRSVERI
ncbi:MAG: DUF3108 domain-containing protein [Candidatus Omnitrophica bacterium]|nr:DUF3108 domain-containing protein [Candidatus Omnitrophota bacterium]